MWDLQSLLEPWLISSGATGGRSFSGHPRHDSRKVEKGDIFFAIPGSAADGHRFIDRAVASGAAAVVYSDPDCRLPEGVANFRVGDSRAAHGAACREFFGRPDESLELVAVTGTNGKTTTAFLLQKFFNDAAKRCALISTVSCDDGRAVSEAHCTTPEPEELFELLDTMRGNGVEFVAMEMSSHALDQRRAGNGRFRTAIFTNLTGDHLDYHKDMESYFAAKKLLFDPGLAAGGTAVINCDDPYGARLLEELRGSGLNLTGFSRRPGAAQWLWQASRCDRNGAEFTLSDAHEEHRFATTLVGEHNLCNIVGALLGAHSRGVGFDSMRETLLRGVAVPGRLEKFSRGGVDVFVDYAHTDDALANVLSILRRTSGGGGLTAVFGAGGDRDRSKRPRMAAAVGRFADRAVVTSDNPRSESPGAIIAEITAGFEADFPFVVEEDRHRAISSAILAAAPGDTILIAGKGHENYQETNGVRCHFDDREEARAALLARPER